MEKNKTPDLARSPSWIKLLPRNRSGAMEMSVGTIVTIVLLMSVLVLGIFLVQKIFGGATGAIDSINTEVENEIQKLFSDEGKPIAIYPPSRDIKIKKGDDPKGFAFSVLNKGVNEAEFEYEVLVNDISKCGTLTQEEAQDFLIGGSGIFSLGPGNSLDLPRLVKFDVPDTAPPCTMTYSIRITKNGGAYTGGDLFVTIK